MWGDPHISVGRRLERPKQCRPDAGVSQVERRSTVAVRCALRLSRMTASPRLPATIALLALPIILILSVVYERGRVPIRQALRTDAPLITIGVVPLLLIVWQLRDPGDRLGLAVGIAFPVIVFALTAVALSRMMMGNSEQQMAFLMAFLAFLLLRSWFVLEIIFFPALAWLLFSSLRAYFMITAEAGGLFLAAVAGVTALAVVVPYRRLK
jgi:hypothetical protein